MVNGMHAFSFKLEGIPWLSKNIYTYLIKIEQKVCIPREIFQNSLLPPLTHSAPVPGIKKWLVPRSIEIPPWREKFPKYSIFLDLNNLVDSLDHASWHYCFNCVVSLTNRLRRDMYLIDFIVIQHLTIFLLVFWFPHSSNTTLFCFFYLSHTLYWDISK